MPIRVSDNKSKCDFHLGEMEENDEYDIDVLDPGAKKALNSAGFFKLCFECAEPIIESVPYTPEGESYYACPFLRKLEANTKVLTRYHGVQDTFRKWDRKEGKYPDPIGDNREFKNKLECLLAIIEFANDDFAEKRRKMIRSFMLQGLQRSLSKKQIKVIQWTFDLIGEYA